MSFTPTSWTGHKRQSDAPKVSNYPNAPFYLLHSPFAWELVQLNEKHWAWLPQFGQLNEIAGVNGIEETAQGADSTITRVKLQEKGINVIDREFGYIARYETKFGGYFYTLKWNMPKIIGSKTYWNMDEAGFNEFRLQLIEMGVIAYPEIEVVQSKMKMLDKKIDRRLKMQHIPEIKKEIDGLYDLRKTMMQTFEDAVNPKPKSKKRGA